MHPSVLTAFLSAFALGSMAMPVDMSSTHVLQARADCADGKDSPCICGDAFGIRLSSAKVISNCQPKAFKFKDTASQTDGTLQLVNGNVGTLQCDHIVELQFIAENMPAAACTIFNGEKVGKAAGPKLQAFINKINSAENLVFVESDVNNAKGHLFSGDTLAQTTSKAASGVASYLTLLKANGNTDPGTGSATKVAAALTAAGASFAGNFQTTFDTKVTAIIAAATAQAKKLLPKPTPGDPFVNSTPANFCPRELAEPEPVTISSFVKRILGLGAKKPATTTGTAAACALPPPKGAPPATPPKGAPPVAPVVPKPAVPVAPNPAVPVAPNPVVAPKPVSPAAPKPVLKTAPKVTVPKKLGRRKSEPKGVAPVSALGNGVTNILPFELRPDAPKQGEPGAPKQGEPFAPRPKQVVPKPVAPIVPEPVAPVVPKPVIPRPFSLLFAPKPVIAPKPLTPFAPRPVIG